MNSRWLLVTGYVVLVALCLVARRRERERAGLLDGVWRPFWLVAGGFLAAMAIARAGDLGDLVSSVGRGRAGAGGWYDIRRPLQIVVLLTLVAGWLLALAAVLSETWERRRRYLPMGLMAVTLAAYAAIRLVSFHKVDVLLYYRELAGVRFGTMVEMTLLIITALVTLWIPVGTRPEVQHDADVHPMADPPVGGRP